MANGKTFSETSTTSDGSVKKKSTTIIFQVAGNKTLEAPKLFPEEPTSSYLSSYFPDSFDFPYNPDPLSSGNNYKIYDEMKHDDQVKAAISFKKDQILGPGWQIKCDVPEIVERLEQNLKEGLDISFEDSLRDMMSSYEYGFSLTEILYKRAEDGLIEIKDFKTRPPHTFEFYLDPKGDIQYIRQNADTGPVDFEKDYFMHYIYQPEFGNPFGQSDLRAAHTPWKAKKFFLRFWAMYVERFAMPTVVAEYPENFGTDKATRLQDIVKTIQNATTLVVPEGTKIDFKMANRDSSNVYENGINLLNTMIARAILMPDLLGVSGEQTRGGSYALGDTQFQLFMGMIKREQEALARKITLKVIKPLVRANWGDYPAEFEFKPHSKDDAMESLKIWVEATKSKLWKMSEEEVKHFLEMVKFPVPETVEINDTPPPQPFGNPPFQQTKKPQEIYAEDKTLENIFNLKIYRDLTKYEKTMNFSEIRDVLDKNEDKTFNKLKSDARDIYTNYLDQIKDRNLLGRFKPELINDLDIKNQKPMNLTFKAFLKDLYIASYNRAQKEFFPKTDKKFALDEELLPEDFLKVIDAEAFKLVGDYSVNITNKMRNKLVQGIKNGINERDLLSQLRELGNEETDRWLKTVIRTKSTEMFNRGRKAFWDNDPIAQQIVEAYQFSAILDDRTSEVCRYLDGKVFEKGELTNNINPPLHFNCRSILVPVTKFEEYTPDKEPSLDKLKDMGGNLIFSSKNFKDEISQRYKESGMERGIGEFFLVKNETPGTRLQILSCFISNMSLTNNIEFGLVLDGDPTIFYPTILAPKDTFKMEWSDYVLPENKSLMIFLKSDAAPVGFTVEYKIVTFAPDPTQEPIPPPIPEPTSPNPGEQGNTNGY